MAVPVYTVELAHDDGTDGWTDITDYTLSNSAAVSCTRGRSRVLGEWTSGSMTVQLFTAQYKSTPFAPTIRLWDPFDDSSGVFQPRPGDAIRVTAVPSGEAGAGVWRGWVDSVQVRLVKGSDGYSAPGQYPRGIVTLQCSDALARAARVLSNALGDDDAMLSSSAISQTLTAVGWDAGSTVGTGTQYVSAAFYNVAVPATNNLLAWLQLVTATEGGASRLYASRGGSLVWRGRNHRPDTVLEVGDGSSFGLVDVSVDVTDDEWASQAAVTPAAHTDVYSSSSSVAMGTGAKTFTISRVVAPCTAGAAVTATATAGATPATGEVSAFMTGTVTSCTTTTLVIDATSASGTGTGTAWSIETSEPGTAQVATDAQAVALHGAPRQRAISTLHANRTVALAEAYLRAAEGANPSRRISSATIELANLSAANQQTVLALEIGDALDVSIAFGAGDPATFRQMRLIDGIAHTFDGSSHRVTFTLGKRSVVQFTATLKQSGTVTSTTGIAEYSMDDSGVIEGRLYLSAGAAGSAGNAITVESTDLPDPATGWQYGIGYFYYLRPGVVNYGGAVAWDGTSFELTAHGSTDQLGADPSFAIASGHLLSIQFRYRPA